MQADGLCEGIINGPLVRHSPFCKLTWDRSCRGYGCNERACTCPDSLKLRCLPFAAITRPPNLELSQVVLMIKSQRCRFLMKSEGWVNRGSLRSLMARKEYKPPFTTIALPDTLYLSHCVRPCVSLNQTQFA